MKLLDQEQAIRKQIFEYFGYVEDWRILPFDDAREMFWRCTKDEVYFGESEEDVRDLSGDCYCNEIYTQRHLPKWVYRAEEYTMIVVDTHTDGNQLLQIFDNKLEVK